MLSLARKFNFTASSQRRGRGVLIDLTLSPRFIADEVVQIDVLHWMSRTALELIAQSGFGYSFDDLGPETVEHPYSTSAKSYL
jgi:hypothetical protein